MSKPRNLTLEQITATKERREQFSAMIRTVAKMTDEERNALAQKCLATSVEGKTFSPTNQMLIAYQRPGVTVLGGFAQWLKQKRCVRKGERGILIWIPRVLPNKGEAETETRVAFFMGTVFDISQTEEINVHH